MYVCNTFLKTIFKLVDSERMVKLHTNVQNFKVLKFSGILFSLNTEANQCTFSVSFYKTSLSSLARTDAENADAFSEYILSVGIHVFKADNNRMPEFDIDANVSVECTGAFVVSARCH